MSVRALAFVGFLGAIAGFPAGVFAQHPAPVTGTVAGIAPAPASAPAKQESRGTHHGAFVTGRVPVLVFPDGRVFADFGLGWEQVVRQCGLPVNYGIQPTQPSAPAQPVVSQPTVTQPAIGPASTLQPVQPAQPLQSNQQTAGSQSCWSVGPTGLVGIGRP
jgi:hypothetical protein